MTTEPAASCKAPHLHVFTPRPCTQILNTLVDGTALEQHMETFYLAALQVRATVLFPALRSTDQGAVLVLVACPATTQLPQLHLWPGCSHSSLFVYLHG